MYKHIQRINDPGDQVYFRFMGMRPNGRLYSPQVGFDFPMEEWKTAYHIPKIDMKILSKIWEKRFENPKAFDRHYNTFQLLNWFYVDKECILHSQNFSTGHVVLYDFQGFAVTNRDGLEKMKSIFHKTAPMHDGSNRDNKLCIVSCRAEGSPREADDASVYKLNPCYIFNDIYIEEVIHIFN